LGNTALANFGKLWAHLASAKFQYRLSIRGTDSRSCFGLAARYRQNRHDLDGLARKDGKVRVSLEHLRCSLERCSANHRKRGQQVGDLGNTAGVDFPGLAERTAHLDDGRLML